MKAMMKHVVAAKRVGNMRVPNQPMYKRLSVEVTQLLKRSHRAASPFLVISPGAKELTPKEVSMRSTVSVVETSVGTKFRAEDDLAPMRGDATLGMLKASLVEANRVTTMERENFIVLQRM